VSDGRAKISGIFVRAGQLPLTAFPAVRWPTVTGPPEVSCLSLTEPSRHVFLKHSAPASDLQEARGFLMGSSYCAMRLKLA
jgi:hypothetical protein